MKNRFHLFVIFSLFLIFSKLSAQVDTLWTRRFGGEGWDFGESVQQTIDGGYIITGVTGADIEHVSDVYLVKTDSAGFAQWIKSIGRSQTQGRDYGLSVHQTEDTGYIITGFTMLPDEGKLLDLYLIKTDESGDTVWTRTFGDSLNESGQSVRQTVDGGYIAAGYTYSYGKGGSDFLLVKTDASGDVEWMRTFGGMLDEMGFSVQQTLDGGYILVGNTSSFGAGEFDVYLVRTDESGDTLWTRTYGGVRDDHGFSVEQTSSGGYIITGQTESYGAGDFDVYLIRTNESGDTLWTRTFGGLSVDAGFSVTESIEGGFVITGKTMSFGGGDDDIYLIKTDDSGNTIWTWALGGTLDEAGRSVRETTDGGYIISGNIGSYYSGQWDIYLIKTSAPAVSIDKNAQGAKSIPGSVSLMQNYPNPFNPVTIIQYEISDPTSKATRLPVEINVYDIRGRFVRTLIKDEKSPGVYRVRFNGRDEKGLEIPSGVYLYRIRTPDFTDTRKMILME